MTFGQRGLKAQPGGIALSRGIAPSIWVNRVRDSPIDGMDPISPWVYGWTGR